ncbi:MAG TPA: undecaprenyl-phosphate galactose phosphotransferase WbaP, partial [Treponema sp.]|nr:undecaprenyl-phosphate galactose phosphotransferase WbaP [Treponema sp.]
MAEQDFTQYFSEHFRHTTSFFSGILLMAVDAIMLMLSIGIGFFIINAIIPDLINFRSFVQYAIYLPPILVVFYAASLYPGILLAPQEEVKRFSLCTFFAFMGIAFSINMETQEQVSLTFNIDMEAKERLPIAVALITAWPFATVLLSAGREAA